MQDIPSTSLDPNAIPGWTTIRVVGGKLVELKLRANDGDRRKDAITTSPTAFHAANYVPIRPHPEPQYPPASSPPENLEMTSRQPAPRTTTASGVRRNLFSHSLSRRPTTSSTSGTSATTLQVASEEANADIVARDEHGNYLLEQPTMTPMPRNELQEERGGFIYTLNLQWLLTDCG